MADQKMNRLEKNAEQDGLAEELATESLPAEDTPQEEAVERVDELDVLRRQFEESKAKEGEYLDGWQRARAELANARKRFQREQEQAYANARADVLVRLLPIVDDLKRAFETLPEELSASSWIDGVRLVQRKFQTLLEQEGVTPIEACGEQFDPFLHQAVTHEPSGEVPEGHIIAEIQVGYAMGERVLRPSVVRVSAGAPTDSDSAMSEEQGDEETSQEELVSE